MTFLLMTLGVFLVAYGNAMNNVVHRRRAAQFAGKEATIPVASYRYGAFVLIAIGLALVSYLIIWVIFLGRPIIPVG